MSIDNAETIITFWHKAGPKKWFAKNDDFDAEIADKFVHLIEEAGNGGLQDWLDAPRSCLAYILLLDQFTRNIYRNDGKAFAYDPLALKAAKHAFARGFENEIDEKLRSFFVMPFMHSEAIEDQLKCIELMKKIGGEGNVKFAIIHYDIIKEFGRFPHRNAVLGRESSAEELVFLAGDGFKG